jgi:hypothetical protein
MANYYLCEDLRMARIISAVLLLALLPALVPLTRAEDTAGPELLPPPRIEPPEAVIVETRIIPPYYRVNRYDVWQYYGVDRTGHFRARVIYSPYGPYYLYNGEPFPWASTHQREFMPYVAD